MDKEHFILYAKGHYVPTLSLVRDLKQIARKIGIPDDEENIIKVLAGIAFQAITEHDEPVKEFREMELFLYRNRSELMRIYAPSAIDDDGDIKFKMESMLLDQILKSLLVIIAIWMAEIELPEPDPKILAVTSPPKKEKKK